MKYLPWVALALALGSCGCGMMTVPPGEVGVKVNMVGGNRGVDSVPLVTGRVFFNPFNERIYTYPTYAKNYVYSAKSDESSKIDESITFSARGGIAFRANVGIVVAVREAAVPHVFAQYRQSLDNLIVGIVHNEVRDAFNRHAGDLDPLDVLAARKAALLDSVRVDLNRGNLGQAGFDFSVVSFTDTPTPIDPNVQAAINQVFQQAQAAKKAEQAVATARFIADAAIAKARGDSASIVIQNAGDAKGNLILRQSLSPELIQYVLANRWHGDLPQVTGGAIPLLNMGDMRKR